MTRILETIDAGDARADDGMHGLEDERAAGDEQVPVFAGGLPVHRTWSEGLVGHDDTSRVVTTLISF